MYTHIICINDKLWDIMKDGINIQVNGVGMVSDRKSLTPEHKKIYRKHEMELNGDEPIKKSKTLALKSVVDKFSDIAVRSSRVIKSEEAFDKEDSDGDTDDEQMSFIIKRFQHLTNKNKRFSNRIFSLGETSFRVNKVKQKERFNCQKPEHFIADCPELQKDKTKKGNLHKNDFRRKFKKSLMETCDELDDEEKADKNKEEANLALMALIYSKS